MSSIPRDPALDSTLALLSEGYTFISNRCRRLGSDVFETRLMLAPVYCMMGAEAAEVFYVVDRFTRRGAIPQPTLRLLQDVGSVATLDGDAHRWRKHMFMSLMSAASIRQLVDAAEEEWRAAAERWRHADEVVLHEEAQEILCRAACAWAGVPLAGAEAKQRTREIAAMIDGAGAVGPRNWKGLLLRNRTERWVRGILEEARSGARRLAEGSAAHAIAWHRDPAGRLMELDHAVVELINVLRPTVAVAWYFTFAALALHQHPETLQRLRSGPADEAYLEMFVQEVRRFYPFFPAVGGRVLSAFEWRGHRFTEGTWVLLDLYGTNHDPRSWDAPGSFQPERFRDWNDSAYSLVPQGGGDHFLGHRCAGEWITIELLKRLVRLQATAVAYEVPPQDLRFRLSRMPAIPESRFRIRGVRPAG